MSSDLIFMLVLLGLLFWYLTGLAINYRVAKGDGMLRRCEIIRAGKVVTCIVEDTNERFECPWHENFELMLGNRPSAKFMCLLTREDNYVKITPINEIMEN